MRNIYFIIAKQVVEEAGKIIKEARETNTFGFNFKEDNTPVSNIDQQVQDYMTKRLKDSFDIQVIDDEIKKIRTNRKDTNFSIYSPLADGADRFVTKSTIELLDAKLIVPIPFKLNEYLKDFNESSKKY